MRAKRLSSLLLALVCALVLLSPALPALAAAGNTYYVKTASGFVTLAKKCTLDSYSKGIVVELMNDIDLTGSDFEPVPIFNGVFNGNGYTISGLNITRSGSHVGLFRYVGEGGTVKDLNVRGSITPAGSAVYVGGIAGSNSGTITGCSFYGNIVGASSSGGIAGANELSGYIKNCRTDGYVTCQHYTGGVVGLNLGIVEGCVNYGSVNIALEEVKLQLEDIDFTDLNAIENVASYTDTGGVCGFSSGVVLNCENQGAVGYQHMGYNVGGVCGRQSGYMYGCVNRGEIKGRKEVGGIVGQMEPYLTLLFSSDTTQRLKDEFNVLHKLLDKTLNDAQGATDTINSRLDRINEYTDDAADNMDFIVKGTVDFVETNIGEVNEIVDRIDYVMDGMPGILDSLESAMTSARDSLAYLKRVNEDLSIVQKMEGSRYDETDYQLLTVTGGTGGTVTSSPANPAAGGEVKLAVITDTGYVLDSLTVTDADGAAVALTPAFDLTAPEDAYTFTMPTLRGDPVNDPVNAAAKPVVVKASFAPDGTNTDGLLIKTTHGGYVTADDPAPGEGTTVDLTIAPNKGYALSSLTVTALNGVDTPQLTRLNDQGTRFSFVMPAGGALVDAAFQPMSDWEVVGDSADDINLRAGDLSSAMNAAEQNLKNIETIIGYTYNETTGQWEPIPGVNFNWATDGDALTQELLSLANNLTAAGSAASDVISATSTLVNVLGPYAADALVQATADLNQALTHMENAANSLTDATGSTKQIISYLNGLPDIQFMPLGSEYRENVESLMTNLRGFSDNLALLNDELGAATTTLIADLKAVNDQFNVVALLLVDTLDSLLNAEYGNFFEDISNDDTDENRDGKVANSVNHGVVRGDLNVGGVCGAMAIEYDFDPEDDVKGENTGGIKRTYETKSVLRNCVNRGEAISREDCVGCVVGYMDLGSVIACQAYGSALSEEGDYVGGLAGQSMSYVRDSYAMCSLSGDDFVGGAVGSGTYVSNNLCYVRVLSADESVGAVAGEIQTGGAASKNHFVSDTLAGIDGISYSGVAEPITFEALSSIDGIPKDFTSLSVTFMADGQVIKTVSFNYGDSLDKSQIPDIPEKEGYYGMWPEADLENMTFSQMIEAEYISLNTSLSTETTRQGTQLPLILVEGEFHPGSAVSIVPGEEQPDVDLSRAELELWTVTVDDPEGLPAQTHTVHFLAPEKKSALTRTLVYVKDGDAWRRVNYRSSGSYLLFDANGDSFELACIRQERRSLPIYAIGGAGALAALIGAAMAYKRKKRPKTAAKE